MRRRLSLLATLCVLATGCVGMGIFELNRPGAPIHAASEFVVVTYESRSRELTHWQIDKSKVVPFLKKLLLEDGRVRDKTQLSANLKSSSDGVERCIACSWQQLELGALPALNGGDTIFICHPKEPAGKSTRPAPPPERSVGYSFNPVFPAPAK